MITVCRHELKLGFKALLIWSLSVGIMGLLCILMYTSMEGEMADMAESIVYLTSLMKRVSPEEETVGGPVDVAVLSKGDGFIWMKRKHYFQPDLNPHFFSNYFRKEQEDE